MLQVTKLSCERDQRLLIDRLSFEVGNGEIVHVRGQNGAGKTTLLRILCGLYQDFEGQVRWQDEIHPLYFGHKPGVKDLLTAEENLGWLCKLSHGITVSIENIQQALGEVGLSGFEDVPCGSLSEGQRKRVHLARFYLLDNPMWILDEPFSAIDVSGISMFQARMQKHVSAGGSIIYTSHQPIEGVNEVRELDLSNIDQARFSLTEAER